MLSHTRHRDTLTVRLSGELDQCSAQSVRRDLDDLILDTKVMHLLLDMQDLTFMDSSGIGVLLGRYRTLAARGGTLSVRGMTAQVQRVFVMSGLSQIVGVVGGR